MTYNYSGIWPVAPTPFNDDGSLDSAGLRNILDFIIAQGADGICILANFSEQFLIDDIEREFITRTALTHIAERIPVIVTISHFATPVVVARAQLAKSLGAAMVMIMPPYHGATMRGSTQACIQQFSAVSEVGIPIMLQDAPLSGVALSAQTLINMAKEIEMLKLFKIESVQSAAKIRTLKETLSAAQADVFDGEEGITLMADLEAGATGGMTSAMITEQIKPVIQQHLLGHSDAAATAYARVLPAINYENRQCGFQAAKAAMLAGGIIKSDFCRHPIAPLHPQTRAGLLKLLAKLDPMVLNWAK